MRAPATRDQADAYRFALRRLEAALVRGDPVLLHEQIRAKRRAVIAGVLLGLIALAGVGIVALVSPRPDWTRQAVVVGKESGAMYVVAHGPDRLVPVTNLVAARLVLGALQRGGAASGDPARAVPVLVPDAALVGAPRTAAAGVPGAVAVRPDAPGIAPRWAVCDETTTSTMGRVRLAATAVVAGSAEAVVAEPGTGVLLEVPGGATWLVTGGLRHRVDVRDEALVASMGLTLGATRPASAALVSALPEGVRLERPVIVGVGEPGPAGLREKVGDVVAVAMAGTQPRPYVVLSDGIQEVSPALAQLLGPGAVRTVEAGRIVGVPVVERLLVRGWPATAPRMLEVAQAPVLCWAWSSAPGAPPAGVVHVGRTAPLPPSARTVALAQADGPGPLLDTVVLGGGGGGPVRSVGIGAPVGAGLLALVSETGVAYGVADGETARLLGLAEAPPAPEPAVRLLPCGPAIDVDAAGVLVDVPVTAGCG